MILSDIDIAAMADELEMINPFSLGTDIQDGSKVISYGLSSYGYDLRLSNEYKLFSNAPSQIVDPKNFNGEFLRDFIGDVCIIPPNGFALARSVEYMKIPRNVMTICVGKSTYARCGIIVGVTALEPEWEGHVTIEISNTTPMPVKVYSNEGIVQVIFFQSEKKCFNSYADKRGKYQGQTGITLAR